ncbi:hypothetical protein RHSIM_Rhsim04G0074500 [Rhododendron simsii]|uniref:phosphoenolpyruvate carboxylase n=1 Tax=Rhododendron simsii TaxID=118357 RepID=A0A834H0C5_RHOSS|nr:hypothetical protein RHSIM_Rhsim04G0074500 [Rhododendron simsii]
MNVWTLVVSDSLSLSLSLSHKSQRLVRISDKSRKPYSSPNKSERERERVRNNGDLEFGENDAQVRLLAPRKVSEDDKLVEYDALLLDRFLDILQDLHGEGIRQTVQDCYELSAEYARKVDPQKLEELGSVLTSLDAGDSIVVAKSFTHMLNLANLAEEVQIAYCRRNKLKKGVFADEASATTESDIEVTLMRLVDSELFDPIVPDITPGDKQELDEALQESFGCFVISLLDFLFALELTHLLCTVQIQAAFRTDEIRRTPPTSQDEMRAGMSYFHETIWKGVPKFLRRVDSALKNIGINERVPYNAPQIKFPSWMGGDHDGNPRETPDFTRDVCLLARTMAANLYFSQIEDLMFELSMWRCSDELRARADELHRLRFTLCILQKQNIKNPPVTEFTYEKVMCFQFGFHFCTHDSIHAEFWKQIPPNEPYQVILGEVRDKLYHTRERARQLLANGFSDIAEETTFTNFDQNLCDRPIADGSLLDFLRQVSTFGLSLVRLDIWQESDRHTEVIDAITRHLEIRSYREWPEQKRQEWLLSELSGKRPLFGPNLPKTEEVADVLDTFHVISQLPSDNFGAYIISMATAPSDVLAVELLQHECRVKQSLRVAPLFEKLADLVSAPASLARLFSIDW